MKKKVDELSDIELDYLLAIEQDYKGPIEEYAHSIEFERMKGIGDFSPQFEYHVDWNFLFPLIERNHIQIFYNETKKYWVASTGIGNNVCRSVSLEIAIKLCIIKAKYGKTVDV